MPDLVESTPEAIAWMARMLTVQENEAVFGHLLSAVVWTEATGPDGELLLPLDPVTFAEPITENPYPLQVGHDPGRPMGTVLAAEAFISPKGQRFIAAVLGLYDGAPRIGFGDFGLDSLAPHLRRTGFQRSRTISASSWRQTLGKSIPLG